MVLHGGQAKLTKDKSSGASCGGCGSGSSASSTPAVDTSSSALPKAISDAPVQLSWASVQHDIKATKVVQERLGRDKKDQINDILKDALTELSKTECMLGQFFIAKYDWLIIAIILFHAFSDFSSFLPCSCFINFVSDTNTTHDQIIWSNPGAKEKTWDLVKIHEVTPCTYVSSTYIATPREHQTHTI